MAFAQNHQENIMDTDSETAVVEGDKEDRISTLPRKVMHHILEILPAQDAARTGVLSKKWRYIWSELRYLVLDRCFRDELTEKSYSFFVQTVCTILLHHRGDIIKFFLDVPEDPSSSYTEIDRFILYVTRNGVKELRLSMSDICDRSRIYKLVSCVFTCTNLTRLDLCNCAFKPPNSFLAFPKLETLHLKGIIVLLTTECVLNIPRLINLDLIHCDGAEYLNIVSPLLEELCVHDNHYLVINSFMNCKKLRQLYLRCIKTVDNLKNDERSTWEKLLFSLAPTLEKLCLDSFILELLTADRIPKGPLFMFNCLGYLSLEVEFGELSPVSGALQLIKSVPSLIELEIVVKAASDNAESVLNCLNTPACLDQPLNKLKHVSIQCFQGSIIELLFIKLLLARSPSLARMSIGQVSPFGSGRESIITTALASFPKASSEAELSFPN